MAADVAANIAAAINADATLTDLGIIATTVGGTVTTNGLVSSTDVNDPGLTHRMPLGSVDHYKLYNLEPELVSILNVVLEDQFGTSVVDLTSLERMGLPVSKTHAPELPSLGDLLRPFEHLAMYRILSDP
jgi:hypothetical protein